MQVHSPTFVRVLESLGSNDYERAKRLHGVHPKSVRRWIKGLTKPRADDLLNNPILAEALAADARTLAAARTAATLIPE